MRNVSPTAALSAASLPPVPEGLRALLPLTPVSLSDTPLFRGDASTQGGVSGPRRAHRASQPGKEHPGTSGQGGRKRQAQERRSGRGRVGLWNFRKVGGSSGAGAEPCPAPSEAL